jgi:predicted CoA-binding protein
MHETPETDQERIRHVLQRARTIAIVGASPSPDRHSQWSRDISRMKVMMSFLCARPV